MSLTTGLAIYFIVWWLTLFAILPWGAKSHHEEDREVEPGTAPSAPIMPRLRMKFLVTTLVSAIVFAVVYAILVYDIVSLDDVPFLPTFEY